MRTLLALALMVLLAGAAFADADARETAGIGALADSFAAAWNKHDAKAMASLFNADADVINPMGRSAKGQTAIQGLFSDEQSGAMKGSTLALKVTSIRKLSWNHFFVDGDADITGMTTPDGQTGAMKAHFCALVEKKFENYSFINLRAFSYLTQPAEAPAATSPTAAAETTNADMPGVSASTAPAPAVQAASKP